MKIDPPSLSIASPGLSWVCLHRAWELRSFFTAMLLALPLSLSQSFYCAVEGGRRNQRTPLLSDMAACYLADQDATTPAVKIFETGKFC